MLRLVAAATSQLLRVTNKPAAAFSPPSFFSGQFEAALWAEDMARD
jgi:hypothetical protein